MSTRSIVRPRLRRKFPYYEQAPASNIYDDRQNWDSEGLAVKSEMRFSSRRGSVKGAHRQI
jgi:hypothetical protein